jgi:hypothetical protein
VGAAALIPHPFLNARGRLRNGWWIALFFILLAGLLFPLILMAQRSGTGVPLYQQAIVLLLASLICQALRRRPISELLGAPDGRWPRQFLAGLGAGALLMLAPALVLALSGAVTWRVSAAGGAALGAGLAVMALVAITEELLFRGFLFQRLLDGLGAWPAQLLIAALFTLTHSDALATQGALTYLAGANIFLASLVFGLAYLRTCSLAMPIGLHFAANAVQGPLLGFGVSGDTDVGLLTPVLSSAPTWWTGGAFGLEASVPGLLVLAVLAAVLWRWPVQSVAVD